MHGDYDPIECMSLQLEFLLTDCLIFVFVFFWGGIAQGWPEPHSVVGAFPEPPDPCISTYPGLGLWTSMNTSGLDMNVSYPQGSLVCFMLLLGFSLPSVTFMVKSVSLYTIKCHFFWWLPGPSGWSPLHPCLSKGCCASLTLAPACHPNCLVL